MAEPSKYLEESWKRRTDESRKRALAAIEELRKCESSVRMSKKIKSEKR